MEYMKKIIIFGGKRGSNITQSRIIHKYIRYVILNVITTVINTTIKITERLAKDKSCCATIIRCLHFFSGYQEKSATDSKGNIRGQFSFKHCQGLRVSHLSAVSLRACQELSSIRVCQESNE